MDFSSRINERKAFSANKNPNNNNNNRQNNNFNNNKNNNDDNKNRYSFKNSSNNRFNNNNDNNIKNRFERNIEIDEKNNVSNEFNDEFVQSDDLKYELELESEMLQRIRDERIANERHQKIQKFGAIVFISLCIYIVFLIYGTINTDYVYDEKGEVVPLIVTVDEIKEIKNFDKVVLQYRQARAIYERVLQLDYRIAAGVEDPILVAPEYEKVLDDISSLAIQLGAVESAPEYNQSIEMLLSWVQNDIAIYCQDMSAAIAQNDMERANRAIQYKQLAYENFSQITKNLATLGSQVNGADISDIVEWSPEQYIRDSVGAV